MVDVNEKSFSAKRKQMDCHENEDEPNKRRQPHENSLRTFQCSNNSSGRSENPVLTCLRNHVVLETIFQRLSNYDVKMNCALVNKTWNRVVKHYLMNVVLFQLRLECPHSWLRLSTVPVWIWMREINYNNYKEDEKKAFLSVHLEVLAEKLWSTKKKEVWVGLDYHSSPNPVFFSPLLIASPWLTRLEIDDKRNRYNDEAINYLPVDAPLLRYLLLKNMPPQVAIYNNYLPLSPDSLARLTTISFTTSGWFNSQTIQRILVASQNVVRILNFPVDNIVALCKHEAQSKVKSLNFSNRYICNRNMDVLDFVAPNLHLEKMCIRPDLPKTGHVNYKGWAKFLQSSQSTLKELELWPVYFEEEQLVIPLLPSLTTLVIRADAASLTSTFNYFPNGFDMPQNFPNLHTVEIDLDQESCLRRFVSCLQDNTLQYGHNFQSVRHLKLRDHYGLTMKEVKTIFSAFPEIRAFNVGSNSKWIQIFLPFIWYWWSACLEELSLSIELKGERDLKYPFLDEAITGIPESRCKVLRNSGEKQDIKLDFESFPAISEMKVLKSFSMTLNGYDANWKCMEIISHVAALYGFQLVPGLKVNVRIPRANLHQNAITNLIYPIVPHVNFDSDYIEP